jgi:HK97 family phage major capsid protein
MDKLKEQLEALKKTVKAYLDEAEKFVAEGKIKEANDKIAEATGKDAEIATLKSLIASREKTVAEEADAKNAKTAADLKVAEAKLKEPTRLEGLGEPTPVPEAKSDLSSAYVLRFGEIDSAVKGVIADLYGSFNGYNQARAEQMDSFTKYIRFGESRMTAQEINRIDAHFPAKNLLLRPEVLKSEISTGRTVSEIKATLMEGSLDIGGHLVPEDYRAEIIKRLMGNTVVRKAARVVTTTRDVVEWPRMEGGNTYYTSAVRVTWVEELPTSATAAATNQTYGILRIPIYTVLARTDMSRNLLEDAAFNMLDILAGLFSEAMAIDEDNQFLTGTGGGMPSGLLGARTGAELNPILGIAQSVSGNATALTADGLYDTAYSVASQYRGKAQWAMNRTSQRDARKLKDGNGRYLWQDSIQAGQPATLLGYPVAESEQLPTIAANAFPVLFGDFSGYMIADRVGMTVERITDATLVGQNRVALFARRRLGGAVAEPWKFSSTKIST